MSEWILQNNILSLKKDDGDIITPSASIIGKCVFTDTYYFPEYPGIVFHHPTEDLPYLRFSGKYPKLSGKVSINRDWKINLEFSVQGRSPNSCAVIFPSQSIDHIILDNIWYSLTSPMTVINGILDAAGIDDISNISVAEYMKLRKAVRDFSNSFFWIDEAEPKQLLEKLDREKIETPKEFTGSLYPYQKDGFYWMKHFTNGECGCILADEMGLGKTIQIIALIVSRRPSAKTPALIVCPVSLLENWRREIAKFSNGMEIYTYHGKGILGDTDPLLGFDIVLTTYDIASTYSTSLNKFEWDLVVLDEAQYIKNPETKRTKGVKRLRRCCGIAVSGTPFENRLTDIWSITDFVYPNYLGPLSLFKNLTWDASVECAQGIEPLVRPLLLRRRLSEVATDLPERIDIPVYLELDSKGKQMYEEVRRQIIAEHPNGYALALLTKLRMFCAHPFVYLKKYCGDLCTYSRKYQAFCDIVDNIVANNEKFLVFTSYNQMNEMMVTDISKRWNIPVDAINGAVPVEQRQAIIDRFSAYDGAAGLILHPRSAGTGLNITAANNVIHYNPEWNPAVEDQASARAYRRGQTRTVRVYRLIYSDTLEEVMDDRLHLKRQISDVLVIGNKGDSDRKDLIRALEISPFHHDPMLDESDGKIGGW